MVNKTKCNITQYKSHKHLKNLLILLLKIKSICIHTLIHFSFHIFPNIVQHSYLHIFSYITRMLHTCLLASYDFYYDDLKQIFHSLVYYEESLSDYKTELLQ